MMSMKKDRELIKLAGENLSADQIAVSLEIAPKTVLKIAKRLGVHFGPRAPKRDGRLNAKKIT